MTKRSPASELPAIGERQPQDIRSGRRFRAHQWLESLADWLPDPEQVARADIINRDDIADPALSPRGAPGLQAA
ncbi:hypothetical protein [Sphingosinithalassobacter sp. LHW66-3]|uniref:hypothetical protein n=1 Tax=Sphingosinithalassobacter sp. LHW66-3 TaxID=3424718 RepID=UPI003D6B8C3E